MVSEKERGAKPSWSLSGLSFGAGRSMVGGTDKNVRCANFQVSPKYNQALIEKAAKEPGLKDIAALRRLSEEVTQIDRIRAECSPQPCFSQVTGTAGWLS